jgi:hypothetical protein
MVLNRYTEKEKILEGKGAKQKGIELKKEKKLKRGSKADVMGKQMPRRKKMLAYWGGGGARTVRCVFFDKLYVLSYLGTQQVESAE